MKRLVTLFLAVIALISVSGCTSTSVPSEVKEYANKHEIEVLSGEDLKSKAVVGKEYIVYGTIDYISFHNYEKGSADLEDFLADVDERVRDMMEVDLKGTMRYYLSLTGSPSMSYKDWNFPSKMLNINKGDEVAFIVTCEDGYLAGTYDYVVKEKIWENRHSETTIEEDHDAEIEN